MDERLAVEAELLALPAARGKALVVGEIEMHAVEDGQAEGARGEQAKAEARQHRQALARVRGMEVLGEIGGAHDEAADAGG